MLIAVEDALTRILHHCPPGPVEQIPVAQIDGRRAAASLRSRWDLPQADTSVMDGYAVRSLDIPSARSEGTPVVLTVRGQSAAGHPSPDVLGAGEAARISTGAVIPAGADAVIAQEDTDRDGDRLLINLETLGPLPPGTFIRPRGREVQHGDIIVQPGQALGPAEIALLAGCGHSTVPVIQRPRVAILSTGDELVDVGQCPQPGQVVSSNGLMLAAMVRRAGAVPQTIREVGDDPKATHEAVSEGLKADVLITSGGISVGDHDLILDSLRSLGVDIHIRGIALRPGKPTTFGTHRACRVFALPGNPASCLVSFAVLAHAALRRMGGVEQDPGLPRRRVRLQSAAPGAGQRAHYVRARSCGPQRADPLTVQQSGNLRSIAGADLLIAVPAGTPELPAGTEVDALVLNPP